MKDLETIFGEALEQQSPRERAAYLDEACNTIDPAIRRELEALLAAHDGAGAFMQAPAQGIDGGMWRDVPDDPAQAVGSIIGPYKLLQQIGEGGMGAVFMAEQLHPVRRRVALKIIKPGMDTRQVIARFEAERQALAMMDHANIAKVFDAGATEAGRPFFVMELVKGIPITEYCDQNQLTPRQRLELFMHVCRAVQHAHQKGIIHRDLKPTNVLVSVADDGKPVPKIIDFGIAKATADQTLTDRTLFTEFRQLVGTPLYMSPEQAESRALHDVDTRSDVYSLGVLLYELLTGTTPFDKQRLAKAAHDEVRRIIREEDPPRPSTRLSTLGHTLATVSAQRQTDPKKLGTLVRGELDWIVMKALEKDRTRRYETAYGLARDVERYLSDQPVEACPPTRLYRLRKFARRNKAAMTTISLVAAALIMGIAVSTWQAVRATRAERQVSRERDQVEAQRSRADEQAAIAQAINEFLNADVLGPANPFGAASPRPTVRDALNTAGRRVAGQYRHQPMVEAAIRYALGRAYLAQGDPRAADEQLRIALQLQQKYAGEEDPETLKIMSALAATTTDPAKAEELLTKTLQSQTRIQGEQHPDTLRTMMSLAVVVQSQGKAAEAESLRSAVLSRSKSLSGDTRSRHELLASLWLAYEALGEFEKAEAVALENLETERRLNGDESPRIHELLEGLGWTYFRQGKRALAQATMHEGFERSRNLYGEMAYHTLHSLDLLVRVSLGDPESEKYVPVVQAYVQRLRDTLGEGHPTTLHWRCRLGVLYARLSKFDKAEPLLLSVYWQMQANPAATQSTLRIGHVVDLIINLYDAWGKPDQAATWRGKKPTTEPTTSNASTSEPPAPPATPMPPSLPR